MCHNETLERKAKMQAFGGIARDFTVNIVEGNPGRHVCQDMFGHERTRPHGPVEACEFGVEASADSIRGAVQLLWTSSNYQDLIEQYDQAYVYDWSSWQPSTIGGLVGHWQPLVDTNERMDECALNYGYRISNLSIQNGDNSSQWSVSIEYTAYCACVMDRKKCEPRQKDPLLGICPRGATIYIPFNDLGEVIDGEPGTRTKFWSRHPISVFEGQPFREECHAYILFGTRGDSTEVQIELGEECPSHLLRDADHGCHQLSTICYGVRVKHMSVACCSWRYCNDPEDPDDPDCYNKTDAAGQSASGLMGTINAYLIDPEYPDILSPKLASRVGYCAYHSNMSQLFVEFYDGPPDYCYTFLDLTWDRFVDIAIGWNFDLSTDERLDFAPDKHCTVFHGTIREYCPSVTECSDELGFKALVGLCPPVNQIASTRTVVACRCETNPSEPWYLCDERDTVVTVRSKANAVMPECFEGVLPYSENGTYDEKQLERKKGWTVLCYVHTFTNNTTGMMYRKYGFYNPADEHFARHRGMNCFPMNCTEDESFCCCRTSKVPGKVCNDPNNDLWAKSRLVWEAKRVKSERREPEGIPLNDEEFEKCEGKKPSTHSPQALVAGFVGHDMCFFRQLPHELAHTDEDPEKRTIREFYESSMPAPHPLAAAVCNRERWTLRDWLDGCACQLFRRRDDRVWEKYCCCIATKTETVSNAIKRIRSRNQLRTLGHFLE
ncbi:hypothetical protein AAVH_07160 [Aphelenchoides avenae]|nr:hypothetical protein AAVH_07160 [Aphelenchus avenae]